MSFYRALKSLGYDVTTFNCKQNFLPIGIHDHDRVDPCDNGATNRPGWCNSQWHGILLGDRDVTGTGPGSGSVIPPGEV